MRNALKGMARRVVDSRREVAPAVRVAMHDGATALQFAARAGSIRRDLGDAAAEAYTAVVVAAAARDPEVGRAMAPALQRALYRVGALKRGDLVTVVGEAIEVCPSLSPLVAEVAPDLLNTLSLGAVRSFVARAAEVHDAAPEKAESFLRGRSATAHQAIRDVAEGAALDDVRRVLTLYARAHAGREIGVQSLPEGEAPYASARAIHLPERVRVFNDSRDLLLYRVMTARCAGYLEFGTLELDLDAVDGPWAAAVPGEDAIDRLAKSFPNPTLARDLFQVVEDWRVERRVRETYPGVARDIDALRAQGADGPRAVPQSGAGQVVWAIAHRAWGLELPAEVPEQARQAVDALMPVLNEVTGEGSDVGAVAGALPAIYRAVRDAALGRKPRPRQDPSSDAADGSTPDAQEQPDPGSERRDAEPAAAAEDMAQTLAALAAQLSRQAAVARADAFDASDEADGDLVYDGVDLLEGAARIQIAAEAEDAEAADGVGVGAVADAEVLQEDRGRPQRRPPAHRTFGEPLGAPVVYPEWDHQLQDHKPRWVRVQEHRVDVLGTAFAQGARLRHRQLIRRLRKSFEALHPDEIQRRRRLVSGDEVDLDAAIEAHVARRAGVEASDRVYARREHVVRDVAVAFLLDLSSSTSEIVARTGRTLLDTEKEALVCISEAVDAAGDPFAVYGFSGYGREHVAFYVAKEFTDPLDDLSRDRIGGLTYRMENRDGAAIRHATARLMKYPARQRLLWLLSDGRPLDCGCPDYMEQYAQEDTRMALREARQKGVHAFCLTVDARAEDYLEAMYGKGHYAIVDRVETLPTRLPALYRRLTR
jgi:nitric oxide reductase NorD protein